MVETTRLPFTSLAQLELLAGGPRIYRIGSSVLQSLMRRGFVEAGEILAAADPCREYRITDAGRAALALPIPGGENTEGEKR